MQNKKIKIILKTALPWLVVLVAVGVLEGWFFVQKLESKKLELEKASIDYNETMRQMSSFSSIQEAYDSFRGNKEKIQGMIVTQDNTLDLIQELEEAARETGVILKTSVGDKPLTKKGGPSSKEEMVVENKKAGEVKENQVWLQVDIEGNFENTARFIKIVENAEKIISVATLEMKQLKISTPQVMLENKDGSLGQIHTTILVTNEF